MPCHDYQGATPPRIGPSARPNPDRAQKGPDLGGVEAASQLHHHAPCSQQSHLRIRGTHDRKSRAGKEWTASARGAPPPSGGPRAPNARAGKERPASASTAWEWPGRPRRQRQGERRGGDGGEGGSGIRTSPARREASERTDRISVDVFLRCLKPYNLPFRNYYRKTHLLEHATPTSLVIGRYINL